MISAFMSFLFWGNAHNIGLNDRIEIIFKAKNLNCLVLFSFLKLFWDNFQTLISNAVFFARIDYSRYMYITFKKILNFWFGLIFEQRLAQFDPTRSRTLWHKQTKSENIFVIFWHWTSDWPKKQKTEGTAAISKEKQHCCHCDFFAKKKTCLWKVLRSSGGRLEGQPKF